MKPLSKILTLGLITLASLTGCTKEYSIDNKVVKHNPYRAMQLVVQDDISKTKYYAPFKWNSSKTTGKDITMVVKYTIEEPFINFLSKEDSLEFNKEIKKADYYLNKIDSTEKVK